MRLGFVQIWATDKRGGLSHCDLREGGLGRRRYEVGEGKKLGGVSVNRQSLLYLSSPLLPFLSLSLLSSSRVGSTFQQPSLRAQVTQSAALGPSFQPKLPILISPPPGLSLPFPFPPAAHPWLVCTAGNDQHVRIWDVRHLAKINPHSSSSNFIPAADDDVKPEPSADGEAPGEEEEQIVETWPTVNVTGEEIKAYSATKAGKGLVQGVWRHGKSCSSAVWDP